MIKITVYKIRPQTLWQSIIQDVSSIGILCAAFWFNFHYIDGNNFLDLIIFIGLWTYAVKYTLGKMKKTEFKSKEELLKHLQEQENEQARRN